MGVTTTKGFRVSFWSDPNVLKLTMVIVAQLSEYTKNYSIVQFKRVNGMECEMVKVRSKLLISIF